MNSLLIQKLIKTNNESYPECTYSNPLLDKNVAKALSRSFVKILGTCKENTNVNNNVRSAILENIRKLCVISPENHVKIDENLIEILIKFYETHIEEARSKNSDNIIEKKLDTFLVQKHKEFDLDSRFKLNINPEIVQSLLNLNNDLSTGHSIYQDLFYWDINKQFSIIIKDLWNNYKSCDLKLLDNLSLKMKTEIENTLLELCYGVINNIDCNIQNILTSNKYYNDIIDISSNSPICFQICSSILNYILINTYFNEQIQRLINEYINYVKLKCIDNKFSLLYPHHLISIVSLMDVDVNDLPHSLQNSYTIATLEQLKTVHIESETNAIMLLSHFPNWFDLYFT